MKKKWEITWRDGWIEARREADSDEEIVEAIDRILATENPIKITIVLR